MSVFLVRGESINLVKDGMHAAFSSPCDCFEKDFSTVNDTKRIVGIGNEDKPWV